MRERETGDGGRGGGGEIENLIAEGNKVGGQKKNFFFCASRERGMEGGGERDRGGRLGEREREEGTEGVRGRERQGRKGGRERGREGRREGGREGGRAGERGRKGG